MPIYTKIPLRDKIVYSLILIIMWIATFFAAGCGPTYVEWAAPSGEELTIMNDTYERLTLFIVPLSAGARSLGKISPRTELHIALPSIKDEAQMVRIEAWRIGGEVLFRSEAFPFNELDNFRFALQWHAAPSIVAYRRAAER